LNSPAFIQVIETSRLPPETSRSVEVKGRRYAVFNSGGKFFAIDDTCPHAGASLGDGFCENGVAHCPLHGWAFELETGACLSNPRKPVNTYPTRVVDGWLEIAV
jgi:nitrite reductase (NADH) small subunit